MDIMDKNSVYEVIGEMANNSKGKKIKGVDIAKTIGRCGRGIFCSIAAAYRFFYKKGDSSTAENIAKVFVDKNGNYPYKK